MVKNTCQGPQKSFFLWVTIVCVFFYVLYAWLKYEQYGWVCYAWCKKLPKCPYDEISDECRFLCLPLCRKFDLVRATCALGDWLM